MATELTIRNGAGAAIPGHAWHANGQSTYSGELLRLYHRLDALFCAWGREQGAEEYSFPISIPAAELQKIDYFRSFPHLVNFAACLDGDPAGLKAFSEDPMPDGEAIAPAGLAPIRDVLTPAACYHFYVTLQGSRLDAPRYLTTRCHCFRREERYLPMQRQWCFSMREIVCIGTEAEVVAFLEANRRRVTSFLAAIGLDHALEKASDPFFQPARNKKRIFQLLNPVKTEVVFEGSLAIGSFNHHRGHFGEAFGISRNGAPADSGCVAFGIDRWMHAWLRTYGSDPAGWPDPAAAA